MKIHMNIEVRFGGRSGVEARSPDLRLTSHGIDEQEALQSLQRGILVWCEGLQSLGKLEKVLKGKRLRWEADGENIDVELHPLASSIST